MKRRDEILDNIVMLVAIVVAVSFLIPYGSAVAHAWNVGMRVLWGLWLFWVSGGV